MAQHTMRQHESGRSSVYSATTRESESPESALESAPQAGRRISLVATASAETASLAEELVALARRGLPQMWRPELQAFAQTMRASRSDDGPQLRPEGTNLRYSAIVALGTSRLDMDGQRAALTGMTAADLARVCAAQARNHADDGAVALAAWAAAEVTGAGDDDLVRRIRTAVDSGKPLPTVNASWMLSAALASQDVEGAGTIISTLRRRLLEAQGPGGVFPHALPASSQGRLRAHVGCFADQVYPIQALARLHGAVDDEPALRAAEGCARTICQVQGTAGQWWWHYDSRNADVVERFPVYSVHQHAMGPMCLFELAENGGESHVPETALGLSWLKKHPEAIEELISDRFSVVWRKIGRAEPPKAARKLAAFTTALRPGLHFPAVDTILRAGRIDYECRPYELGWLLYALVGGPITDGHERTSV